MMKIFLVEDSPGIRQRLKTCILALDGLEISGESDNEITAIAEILRLQPDLAVVDLALANGTGLGVLKRVKAACPALRVIIFTNHSAAPYREKCRQLGADHFLDKNREFDQLGALLASAARTQTI